MAEENRLTMLRKSFRPEDDRTASKPLIADLLRLLRFSHAAGRHNNDQTPDGLIEGMATVGG